MNLTTPTQYSITTPTFLVSGVLFKGEVSKMEDSRYHSEDVSLLLHRQTNPIHRMLKDFELFSIVNGGIGTGGGV